MDFILMDMYDFLGSLCLIIIQKVSSTPWTNMSQQDPIPFIHNSKTSPFIMRYTTDTSYQGGSALLLTSGHTSRFETILYLQLDLSVHDDILAEIVFQSANESSNVDIVILGSTDNVMPV